MKLIGITGKKGSGKSQAAKFLEDEGYRIYNFADPLKEATACLLGTSPEFIHNLSSDEKEKTIPGLKISYREFLQELGTGFIREKASETFWIDRMRKNLVPENGSKFVIGDVRFDNEVEFIHSLGGKVIQIERPGGLYDPHKSESGVRVDLIDKIIDNFYSLERFRDDILEVERM